MTSMTKAGGTRCAVNGTGHPTASSLVPRPSPRAQHTAMEKLISVLLGHHHAPPWLARRLLHMR